MVNQLCYPFLEPSLRILRTLNPYVLEIRDILSAMAFYHLAYFFTHTTLTLFYVSCVYILLFPKYFVYFNALYYIFIYESMFFFTLNIRYLILLKNIVSSL